MPIKRRTMSKSKKYHMKSKKSMKTRHNKKTKLNKKSKKNTKHSKRRRNMHKKQKGGFGSDCNLATVKEPGFSVDSLGSIPGLSISGSRAAIFRPKCKSDPYQAMLP